MSTRNERAAWWGDRAAERIKAEKEACQMKSANYTISEIAEHLDLPLNQVRDILVMDLADECYDKDGEFLERGRCDTCGAPCDGSGCTADRTHKIAIP